MVSDVRCDGYAICIAIVARINDIAERLVVYNRARFVVRIGSDVMYKQWFMVRKCTDGYVMRAVVTFHNIILLV